MVKSIMRHPTSASKGFLKGCQHIAYYLKLKALNCRRRTRRRRIATRRTWAAPTRRWRASWRPSALSWRLRMRVWLSSLMQLAPARALASMVCCIWLQPIFSATFVSGHNAACCVSLGKG